MKKYLLALCAFAGLTNAKAQLALETFNGAGMPAGWTMIKVDNNTVSSIFAAPIPTTLTAQGWMKRLRATGDSAMLTASNFTPAGTADRWLITPSFSVNNANMLITWEDWESTGSNYNDSVQVWVSTSGGATPSSFTTKIYDGPTTSYSATPYGLHGASLAAFNGQSIKVAFRNHNTQQGAFRIDNVQTQIVPANDIALVSVAPAQGSPLAYGAVGSNVTLSGVVENKGSTNITSYTVKYRQGTGTVISQTLSGNIPAFGQANFSFTTPFNIASVGNFPIKVWAEKTGDANHTNDTLNTQVVGVSFMPAKKLVFEEATGTWCGWCPRGAVYMDSMYKVHPVQTTLIAVHNADPMVVTAYDNLIGATPGFSGYPSVVVDRREIIDPSEMFLAYNAEKNYFGFADVSFTKPIISGNNLSMTVTVKPAIDMSGDYRLALVLTEDNVHGTASGYNQSNYYSYTSNNIALTGAGHNWQTSPNPIPAAQMSYEFVARLAHPSPSGQSGALPASMTANTNYTYSFTNVPLDPTWVKNELRVAVLLIRGSDGQVLNSASTVWPTDVKQLVSVTDAKLYPNPAKDQTNLSFNLEKAAQVNINVVNVLGLSVWSNTESISSGNHTVSIPTSALASGVYNVNITTEGKMETVKLTVIK